MRPCANTFRRFIDVGRLIDVPSIEMKHESDRNRDLRPATSIVVNWKDYADWMPCCSDNGKNHAAKLIRIIPVGFQERNELPAILKNAHNLRYTGPSGYRSQFLSPLFHIYKRGNGDKINNELLGAVNEEEMVYKSCGRFSRADGTRRSPLCRSRWRFYCQGGSARLQATPREQLRFRIMRTSIVCPATLSSLLLLV